jgi:hypothetical protein
MLWQAQISFLFCFPFLGSRAGRNHGMTQSTGMAVLDHDRAMTI